VLIPDTKKSTATVVKVLIKILSMDILRVFPFSFFVLERYFWLTLPNWESSKELDRPKSFRKILETDVMREKTRERGSKAVTLSSCPLPVAPASHF